MEQENFTIKLSQYLRARFSFLSISTWEEDRVIRDIQKICSDEKLIKTTRKLYTWSLTEGLVNDEMKPTRNSKQPIQALEQIQRIEEPSVFVLKDFHVYMGGENRQPDPGVIRKIRDLVSVIERSPYPKNVIFVSPTFSIPLELQKDIIFVDYGLPTYNDLKRVLNQMIEMNKSNDRIVVDLDASEEEMLIKAALGLTLQEAENAFALSMVTDGRLDINSVDHVLKEKQQIIKKNGLLEYIPQDPSMADVGGLENIKRWLQKRNHSWMDSASEYSLPAPKGILLTGIPGCGKSLIAKAVSSLWRLPLLKLDMGKIFSGLVGSSEENMRKAIETAEAISPSILWIDEIEKGLGGTNTTGDSGTSTRIFGTLLTWMQEKTDPVFVVATANDIQSLPPELLRKGRFDEIFFVDLPTTREREKIFEIHINKRLITEKVKGHLEVNETLLRKLADLSEGFIGAEIEQAVITGLFEAYSNDRSLLSEDIEKAIKQTVPLSVTQAERIRALRDWANVRAVTATLQDDREDYENDPKQEPDEMMDIRRSRGGRTLDF
ncbi:AAA family ATPase [Virgibacillus sp. MSJ-26]|uniref:AAA family ATPase n=1 Tax=Virgibacillus sp. MSJ-26 TaxID=2841522 RepID=UPI001C1291CF|nr:AAA family ATPase [Virgibacillus sp. MSJ-26]MBU5468598.1 AAA family ATPase [Virgibacillus sp. MSJ-26]